MEFTVRNGDKFIVTSNYMLYKNQVVYNNCVNELRVKNDMVLINYYKLNTTSPMMVVYFNSHEDATDCFLRIVLMDKVVLVEKKDVVEEVDEDENDSDSEEGKEGEEGVVDEEKVEEQEDDDAKEEKDDDGNSIIVGFLVGGLVTLVVSTLLKNIIVNT